MISTKNVVALCCGMLMFGPAALAQTEYEYDAAGRLLKVTKPDGTAVIYQYDAAGNRTQRTVTLGNAPPSAGDDSISLGTCQMSYTFDPKVNDSDPEGGALTITSKTDGSKGTVTIVNNELRYDVTPGQGGADSFSYTIEDPQEASDSATVDVTMPEVPSENVEPVAQDDNGGTIPGLATVYISVLNNDTDENCDTLTVTSATVQLGAVTTRVVNGTQVEITSTANGSTWTWGSIAYTISDGRGGTDFGTITFTARGED